MKQGPLLENKRKIPRDRDNGLLYISPYANLDVVACSCDCGDRGHWKTFVTPSKAKAPAAGGSRDVTFKILATQAWVEPPCDVWRRSNGSCCHLTGTPRTRLARYQKEARFFLTESCVTTQVQPRDTHKIQEWYLDKAKYFNNRNANNATSRVDNAESWAYEVTFVYLEFKASARNTFVPINSKE